MGAHNVIERPGVVHFFAGHGPAESLGPCPHDCAHGAQSVIAWGPDWRHYELMVCDDDRGCAGTCRGWRFVESVDDNTQRTHSWRHVGEETPLPRDARDLIVSAR